MNIVKCNQAHAIFKYNFVVTGKSAFCISNFVPLSLDGCWSNFHLVHKGIYLSGLQNLCHSLNQSDVTLTQPIRCNMTVYVKPIRA